MADPQHPQPDEPGEDEVNAPAKDGMAPIITNTGDDDTDGEDVDAPTG